MNGKRLELHKCVNVVVIVGDDNMSGVGQVQSNELLSVLQERFTDGTHCGRNYCDGEVMDCKFHQECTRDHNFKKKLEGLKYI